MWGLVRSRWGNLEKDESEVAGVRLLFERSKPVGDGNLPDFLFEARASDNSLLSWNLLMLYC